MCGRPGPCGVAAPRLSFAGCPGVDGAASGVQVNARQSGALTGNPPGCRVSFPGLRVTSVRRVPCGVIGWSGS